MVSLEEELVAQGFGNLRQSGVCFIVFSVFLLLAWITVHRYDMLLRASVKFNEKLYRKQEMLNL